MWIEIDIEPATESDLHGHFSCTVQKVEESGLSIATCKVYSGVRFIEETVEKKWSKNLPNTFLQELQNILNSSSIQLNDQAEGMVMHCAKCSLCIKGMQHNLVFEWQNCPVSWLPLKAWLKNIINNLIPEYSKCI